MTSLQLSVSVVVPVLNGADTIGDMLNALLSQSRVPKDIQFIVVDNGSSDGTQEIVQKFDVTLLEETTPGVSAARNRGLRHASGDIYINVDADTLPTRYWLREIVAPFADPDVILVGGRFISFKPETAAERYIERAGLYEPKNSVTNQHLPFAIGGNLAVRREAALSINGWSEDLLRGDDVDFSYRLIRRFSTQVKYQPTAVVFHRNRNSDEGLRKQAYGYGHGAATIYRRYPYELHWGASESVKLACLLLHRTIMPAALKIGRLFGKTSDDEIEFATYHRMWTWSFWSGFLRTYYSSLEGQELIS